LNYPFVALVGQADMSLALILNVINPGLSGVLIRGEKGTAKSTAVRALAEILPEITVVAGCPFQCDPTSDELCPDCAARREAGEDLTEETRRVRVVELPVGATEDRVLGTLDLEGALTHGTKKFEPGLLAAAHRGILYVDEVNLLEDHLVDVLLDAAAMGVNTVEREGVSFAHPARFTLVGTMNPEEGELRPQLLDRFGLCAGVRGLDQPELRRQVIRRRLDFEADPDDFAAKWRPESEKLASKIEAARANLGRVELTDTSLDRAVDLALRIGVDGHRGDLTLVKAALTLAAFEGRPAVEETDLDRAARLALPHRVRRQPFQDVDFALTALENTAE
jgi:Mg-chelatase subunit ChlI